MATKEDDEKTSALIAQLLMQDQIQDAADYDYDNPYLDYTTPKNSKSSKRSRSRSASSKQVAEVDEEDDYVPLDKPSKKRQTSPVSPKKRRKDSPADGKSGEDSQNGDVDGATPTKAKRPKKVPTNPNHLIGRWNDKEESLFLEALELFGRDWDKVSEHMATRDKDSVKSHAQKHFIKLFRNNQELPAKVQETGTGHTLSGKPLDINSSEIPCRVSSDLHEWRNDGHTVSSRDSAKLKCL
eukprot:TRINITY_DN4982_c0_g1_i2.p1 TRINITY_DN4982_c0_g1~~TRINITY_DN4982_c0_g1_i2.p1  ORF type:complete len:262 (-),score=34.90 TRINITY_DN4982_c0_g1_i2:49-768(-)